MLNLSRWDNNDASDGFFSARDLEGPGLGKLTELSNNLNGKEFDQMKFNEEKYGLTDDYDENNYTTKLNAEDFTEEDIKKAEKIAESIKKSELVGELKNRHMMEERGLVGYGHGQADDEDEEALYSAVIRPGLKGKECFSFGN